MSTPSTFAITYAPSAASSDPAPSAPSSDPAPGGNTSPPAPNTFSVGGSVSGLSGTVVLQDNGGDDLSVGSDGSFTFATRLVAGGAYNVTVKSSPSGQTCTTSGASGTVASANVTTVAVTCTSQTTSQPGADDFNRPDGGLGAGWAAISDGGLSIASQAVLGTADAQAGDTRIAESYGSDQFSQTSARSASTPTTCAPRVRCSSTATAGGISTSCRASASSRSAAVTPASSRRCGTRWTSPCRTSCRWSALPSRASWPRRSSPGCRTTTTGASSPTAARNRWRPSSSTRGARPAAVASCSPTTRSTDSRWARCR